MTQKELDDALKAAKAKIAALSAKSKAQREQLDTLKTSLRELAQDEREAPGTATLIAEHQRASDHYMYRDRLLVQEFYFAIVAVGLAINLLFKAPPAEGAALLSLVMALLLGGLYVHVRHLRTDRDLMWTRARELETALSMEVLKRIYQQGYATEAPAKRRLAGTGMMVTAVGLFALGWLVALVTSLWVVDYGALATRFSGVWCAVMG